VEAVDRRDEGLHRGVRVRAHLAQSTGQHLVVLELGHSHPRQSGLRRLVGSHLGIGSQPGERRQLTVCQCPEKVDDRCAVGRVFGERIASGGSALDLRGLARWRLSGLTRTSIGEGFRLWKVVHEREQ